IERGVNRPCSTRGIRGRARRGAACSQRPELRPHDRTGRERSSSSPCPRRSGSRGSGKDAARWRGKAPPARSHQGNPRVAPKLRYSPRVTPGATGDYTTQPLHASGPRITAAEAEGVEPAFCVWDAHSAYIGLQKSDWTPSFFVYGSVRSSGGRLQDTGSGRKLVTRAGIEPATPCLKGRCSTD